MVKLRLLNHSKEKRADKKDKATAKANYKEG